MPTPRPLRILVVDDHRDGGESCVELLRLMGHDARLARTGADALRLIAGFEPDVAVLDLGLPDGNGLGLVGKLVAALARRPLLVALTGYGNLEARAREAGFDHYLVKPVAPAVLSDLLARIPMSEGHPARAVHDVGQTGRDSPTEWATVEGRGRSLLKGASGRAGCAGSKLTE